MKKRIKALFTAIVVAVLLSSFTLTASAKNLPDGSVKVLPDHLVVLDDSGRSVSENGEYYFIVENMEESVPYTKKVQIMNLREDGSYRVMFNAQPLFTKGEINLEEECTCEIFLDKKLIYKGLITGEGTPDIRENSLSLGVYAPGESHVMTVTVTWNGTEAGGSYDNGHRIISKDGEEVVRAASGTNHISGETEFKWIFYVAGGEEDISSNPGGNTSSNPGGNTSSNPRGNTSSNPGGNTSSNPGGNTTSTPGGNTTSNPEGNTSSTPGSETPDSAASAPNGDNSQTTNPDYYPDDYPDYYPDYYPSDYSGKPSNSLNTITSFVKTSGVIAVGALLVLFFGTLILIVLLSKKKKRSKE